MAKREKITRAVWVGLFALGAPAALASMIFLGEFVGAVAAPLGMLVALGFVVAAAAVKNGSVDPRKWEKASP